MSKTIKETRVSLPYLPQNIMEEIFHKLFYKTMVRSKLVCKEWNSIISSPKFMVDYYNYRRLTEGNHLIVVDYEGWKGKSSIHGSNYSNFVRQSSLSSIRLPVKDTSRWSGPTNPIILGTYNGLVAVSFDYQLILWNPLTKKQSSVSSNMKNPFDIESRLLYGLCYDGGRDEYSVVIWSNYQSPPVSPSNFAGEVSYETMDVSLYNFKDGRERELESDSFNMRLLDRWLDCRVIGKVICGLPHWVVQLYDFIDPIAKKVILYFDLKEEKFKQMARPNDYGNDKSLLGLAAIDDENQLGCVFHDKFSSSLEIWVMKEYGKSESWTNLLTIPYLYDTLNHSSISYIDVMGFTPDRELLLYLDGERLLIYDVLKRNCREIKFEHITFDLVFTYQPKLISPPDPSQCCKNIYRRRG